MKKITAILIIFCILCSTFIFPDFTTIQAIDQHEVADGTFLGSIENETHTSSTVYTFYCTNDTRVRSDNPDTNYDGVWWWLDLYFNPSGNNTWWSFIYTGFADILDISSPINITVADLYLRTKYTGIASANPTEVYRVNDSWDETTITWNNQPGHNSTIIDSVLTDSVSTWYSFDVKSDVRNVVDGLYDYHGWLLAPETSSLSQLAYYFYETPDGPFDAYLNIQYEPKFNGTRTVGTNTERNNFTFTPIQDYNENVTLIIPVSSDVRGIVDVANNSGEDSVVATEVNTTDELVNNTFWYDSANQNVHIRTTNLTTATIVNWTVNCSYGATFNLIIPTYLEIGQYFHSSGFISDVNGVAISGMIAETRLLYSNGTDALAVNPKHNCTAGNYICTFATTTLLPDIYSVSVEFTDPVSGIVFKEGATLYLSVDPGSGVYVSTFLHFTFYNSNTGTGLPSESFKIFASDDTDIDGNDRIYIDSFRVYTGQTIYYRIDDYFDNQIYPASGNYTTLNITSVEQDEDIPIDWIDVAIKNLNYTILRFSMENGSKFYNATLFPMDTFHFNILPGNYNVTKRYYNPFNGTYIKTETDNISVTSDDFYIASGFTSLVHISWYNTNEALGLEDETLKLYIDDVRQIDMEYYTHINNTINITVKDYYNTTVYANDILIDAQYEFIDLGLTFHSWLFGNKNQVYYMISILKDGGSRWWERGLVPNSEREFIIPTGNYRLRIYYNDTLGTYTEVYNSSHTIASSAVYVIHGTNLSQVIVGQSVILDEILELQQEEYPFAPPSGDGVDSNQPGIPSPQTPEHPDEPNTASDTYTVLRMTQMPTSNEELTVVFIDSGYTSRIYDGVELTSIIGYNHPTYDTPYDDLGHGTFVSYALAKIFQTHLPNVRLISFKVFGEDGQCTATQLLDVFDSVKKLKPDVVSFSGGAYGTRFDKLSKKVEELRNSGIIVVVAAGNLGPNKGTILSPGVSESSICIGAIDPLGTILDRRDDTVTIWSSRGPVPFVDHKPDFTAPGESILGPWLNNEVIASGTSMSTPFIAAGMAIMYANNKGILDFVDMIYFWDGQTVPNILEDAVKDTAFRKKPVDSYGWGIPDFEKANNAVFLKALFSILLFIGLIAAAIILGFFLIWKYYLKDKRAMKLPK